MSRFRANKDLIFMGTDLLRDRMVVEKEKIASHFPGFQFYSKNRRLTSVRGPLHTSYGNRYYVKVAIPSGYPYSLPNVYLLYHMIDSECPHKFSDDQICIMKSDQWSTTLSLAFIVAKTAIWLNKYDSWKRKGKRKWPGKKQHL